MYTHPQNPHLHTQTENTPTTPTTPHHNPTQQNNTVTHSHTTTHHTTPRQHPYTATHTHIQTFYVTRTTTTTITTKPTPNPTGQAKDHDLLVVDQDLVPPKESRVKETTNRKQRECQSTMGNADETMTQYA